MDTVLDSFGTTLRQSALWRLLALGALTLLLLIPVAWIDDLIKERMQRRDQAVQEVSAKWGGQQTITGPALVVPYTARWTETDSKGQPREKTAVRSLTVLPEQLHLRAQIAAEQRYRGIFAVPVYRLVLDASGEFTAPDLATLGVDPQSVMWSRSQVAIGIPDARAIQSRAVLSWHGEQYPFAPGPDAFDAVKSGIHAGVGDPFPTPRVPFAFQLTLNGSAGLYFTPVGEETVVDVESNWTGPSFQGNWLPAQRSIGSTGFTATWQIPFLGRNQPQVWTSETKPADPLWASRFGVDFITPVDEYRMADRSVKYARLFIVLTFGTIWLIEILAQVRVHPIQYLLIGAALCTFYLLELSLAEQIGFAVAYLAASGAVVALVGAYARVALRGTRRAGAVGIIVAALYLYLYVLLTNEDYALLCGSIGLFAAVAATMFLTRRIDWYGIVGQSPVVEEGA
jgi:inner membrane protein